MATRRNRKTFRKSRKTYKKSRRGGANECERLPFSQLSYNALQNNYQKYCMNRNPLKNMLNRDCCITLKNKFKKWTTDGRDFDKTIEKNDYDDTYNKINNIPEDDSYGEENFIRSSILSGGGKSKKKSRKSKRK
jgi:hypothetical protein